MFNTSIPTVTPETFQQEVLQSELPVIVDFYAPWCGPCKMVAPQIERIGQQYEGRVKLVAFDCDAHRDWVKESGIRAVPTLQVYKSGEKVGEVNGANVAPALNKMFQMAAG